MRTPQQRAFYRVLIEKSPQANVTLGPHFALRVTSVTSVTFVTSGPWHGLREIVLAVDLLYYFLPVVLLRYVLTHYF
jgi:hypothetical protein